MKKRTIHFKAWGLLLLMLAVVISGCSGTNEGNSSKGSNTNTGSDSSTTETANWTGTITMYAQAYTPEAKNITGLKDGQIMLRTLADQYEAEHPGIKISFIDEEFKDYTQTIRVKAAAGELFDIFWGQWAQLNGTFPKGIAVDLTPHLDAPNPYNADAATWRASMNETVVNETASPEGPVYNINGDYVATAFFYNKDLFAQAGITSPPDSWSALIDTAQKLNDAGIVAMSQYPDYSWFNRHFLSDFYADDFDTIAAFDGSPGISVVDEAVAIHKDILSTADERFMGWWPLFKELTDTWKQDYLTADSSTVGSSPRNDFLAGKTAIYYDGSWLPNNAAEANIAFELGSFNFPTLTQADTPFTTGEDTSGSVGGPNAAFQFAISTPQANATMKEAGKFEAVLDWLQYVGIPEHVEQIVNENGTFVPTWPGTSPTESMKALAEQASRELRAIGVGNSTPNLSKDLQRTFGLYLSGNIDIDEATREVEKMLAAALKEFESKNDVDFSSY